MISNYHYLKQTFLSVHSIIGVQWLGTNCQIKHVRQGIFKLAISQDNFLLCFYLISLMTHFLLLYFISNYYYFFFTSIVSLAYHTNQKVTFMIVDRNRYSQESYNKLISEVNCNSSKNGRLLDQSLLQCYKQKTFEKVAYSQVQRESHEFAWTQLVFANFSSCMYTDQ